MKRIYIDVTQSYAWEGRVTGIIRVMDEISSRFVGDSRFNTTFVAWDEPRGYFFQVDYKKALLERNREKNTLEEQIRKNKTNLTNSTAIRTSLKLVTKTPVIGHSYKALRSFQGKVAYRRKGLSIKKVILDNDSVLFMPHGGVWESKKYSDQIIKLQLQSNIKLVPIIYDLCPILTPQFCSKGIRIIFERYMKETLAKSDLVLAISENTATDARSWLESLGDNMPPSKVFRLGDEIGNEKSTMPKDLLPKEFILCVGTIEARKNHMGLYYAYKLALQRKIDLPPIVIVGRKGWLADDAYEIMNSDPTLKDKFIFLHNKSDQELAWLYEHSLFSIYPAFYEGWGLPVAESLLHGVPSIASSTSSIPEIAGDLVDYFSPYSTEEIMQKISVYVKDKSLVNAKKARIKKEYKPTTWDYSYDQVTSALLQV